MPPLSGVTISACNQAQPREKPVTYQHKKHKIAPLFQSDGERSEQLTFRHTEGCLLGLTMQCAWEAGAAVTSMLVWLPGTTPLSLPQLHMDMHTSGVFA